MKRAKTERIEPILDKNIPAETRSLAWHPSWDASSLGGGSSVASENLSAVAGAVSLIAGAVASMPASIVQDSPAGPIAAPSAAAARIIARPNAFQSWPAYVASVVTSILMHGNSVSLISYDNRGAVTEIKHIPWTWLTPAVVGVAGRSRLVFDCGAVNMQEAQLLGLPARLSFDEVMHCKINSDAGIVGRSILSRAPGVLAQAGAERDFAWHNLENGAKLSGMVSVGQNIQPDGLKRLKHEFNGRLTGTRNAGKVVFADQGATFTPFQMTAADAELLASRRFSVAEVARLFGVPEPLLQQPTGAAVADLTPYLAAFAQTALMPLVTLIEGEFDDCLPTGQHLRLDASGLQRGSYSAVAAAQSVLKQSAIITANDGRRALGLPAVPDGDTLGTSAPPNYPADAPGVPSMAPKPGPGGMMQNVDTHQNEGSQT